MAVNEENEARLVPIEGGPEAMELQEAEHLAQDAIFKMDASLDIIDQAINHPGLDGSVGLVQGHVPPWNNDTANFHAILAQIQGTAFLQAFESLKGGGQITEIEGRKAENAMARLNRVQSEEGFKKSLNELREAIQSARERAIERSGGNVDERSDEDILAKYGIK